MQEYQTHGAGGERAPRCGSRCVRAMRGQGAVGLTTATHDCPDSAMDTTAYALAFAVALALALPLALAFAFAFALAAA